MKFNDSVPYYVAMQGVEAVEEYAKATVEVKKAHHDLRQCKMGIEEAFISLRRVKSNDVKNGEFTETFNYIVAEQGKLDGLHKAVREAERRLKEVEGLEVG